jgi:alpha-1,3/alpha-1,6-mannosyltransferase
LSLNRFEKKKNLALAVQAFAILKPRIQHRKGLRDIRLVLAGGYDPRLENNLMTLVSLIDLMNSLQLTYTICKPSTSKIQLPPFSSAQPTPSSTLSSSSTSTSSSSSKPTIQPPTSPTLNPDVLILLNFSISQRSCLLHSPHTLALLYTPTNEHFGIGPLEGMLASLPVLSTNTGGPTETVLSSPPYASDERTGWLCPPDPNAWAEALVEIVNMTSAEREEVGRRARARVEGEFGMERMAGRLEAVLAEAVGMGRVGGGLQMWVVIAVLVAIMGVPLVVFG